MAFPKVARGLCNLVKEKFTSARESSALTYYPTEVALLDIQGIPFQLRFSQALAHKPKSNTKPKGQTASGAFDPFESPSPSLLVTTLPHHNIVLNKFAIIPEHFILATREFYEQTHILSEDDLAAAYACIQAYRSDGHELYGFFNCGEHSGASQPRRHLQFLPVESMRDRIDGPWEPLVESITEHAGSALPFATFAENLPEDVTPKILHDIYLRLYSNACRATGISDPIYEGESQISYNIGLTSRVIALCPRRAEGTEITAGGEKGFVGLNGTLLAGTLLVKNEMEWNTLRQDSQQLEKALAAIGYPTSTGKESEKL